MRGAIPLLPLYAFMAWTGARGNYTLVRETGDKVPNIYNIKQKHFMFEVGV
jgi:hypothetical protein